ncbi:MAG: hypothetical protein VX699_11895 [Myxococcota bacterium]|nr:hypothetical protein [Myxococcota bacterium]
MSLVRKLSLEEWFTNHQLNYIARKYCHNNVTVDIDVTELVTFAESKGLKFSPTAAVVKAVGLLALQRPKLNRGLFFPPWGHRIVEFDSVRVNLPVLIANNGSPMLSAMVIDSPDKKSTTEIHQEIRTFVSGDVSDKPISRFVANRSNHFINRCLLRILHFVVFRFPRLHASKGGGFSVSSLVNQDIPGMTVRGVAKGHTSLTFGVSGLKKSPEGNYTLLIGMGVNHSVLSGVEGMDACSALTAILSEPDLNQFYPEES